MKVNLRINSNIINITLILFLGLSPVFAQNIEVKYYENLLKPNKDKDISQLFKDDYIKNFFSYTLLYQNGISLYKNDEFSKLGLKEKEFFEKEEVVSEDENGNKTIMTGTLVDNRLLHKSKEFFYFKKMNENIILCELNNGVQVFQIRDQLFDWNWEITDELKMILGYQCRKAISKIMGYYFEAWYAEEIPINAGPEKFDGLPGLILYVKTSGKEFVADYVKFLDEPVNVKTPEFQGDIFTFQEVFSGASKPSKK